jgi:putative flippase GtrA
MSPQDAPNRWMQAGSAWLRSTSLMALLSRFSFVGIIATLTYLLVANVAIALTAMDPKRASLLGYVVGMIVSFFGQSRLTFRVGANTIGQILRFSVMSAAGLAISYLSVEYAVSKLAISPVWGTLLTAVLIPIASFVIMTTWVFGTPRDRDSSVQAREGKGRQLP